MLGKLLKRLFPIAVVVLSAKTLSAAPVATPSPAPTNSVTPATNVQKPTPPAVKPTPAPTKSSSSIKKTSNNSKASPYSAPIRTTTASTSANEANIGNSLPSDKVVLNFENADIQAVIKAISQLSGKNFVVDPRVKGTVNILSDRPVSKADSYKVLETSLRMQGFACVEEDGVIKVLPEADAKTYGSRTEFTAKQSIDPKSSVGDQIVTRVFVIQRGSATALANSLRPLVAPNNTLAVYPNSNALIITDYSSNINRIAKIIDKLTAVSPQAAKPVMVTMQHAVAADVAAILQSYINGGGPSTGGATGGNANAGNADGPSTSVTVEPTTNALIIYSPIPDRLKEIVDLAKTLDTNIGRNNSNLHVVYLKNAEANHIAEVLRAVVSQQENPDIQASSSQVKFAAEPTAAFGSTGSSGSGGGGGMGGGARSTTTANSNRSSTSNNNNKNNQDDQKVLVQAEPTTNALIIQAPAATYKNLRMIIDMLDVRRAQVMIEAMIADINSTEQGTFGIQWVLGGGNNNVGAIGLANYAGNGSNLSSLATSAMGAAAAANGGGASSGISIPNEVYVGLVTGTTTVGGQQIPGLSVLADMITANSAGNVLARPTIITMDNEEARIMVGQNIGIPNGSYQNTAANAGNLVTTITRQDLGNVLQIKPLITQSGAILLDIYQEDSKLDPNQPVNSANGPSFLKRNMRATILVDDGQIIALGGMTQDQIVLQNNGVPGLSSIPYLGWLFSWQSRTHVKQNLVLFLRPAIIKSATGYKALTNQRYNYVMGLENQVAAKGNLVLPEVKPVNLENQVPYLSKPAPRDDSALNNNENLPIVDLTDDGKNVSRSDPNAISSTTTQVNSLTPPKNN